MATQQYIERVDSSVDGRRFYEGVNYVETSPGESERKRLWCYPSCTTKIDAVYPKDAYLIKWIREQGIGGQAIFEKAGEDGTEAHVAIDNLIAGEQVPTELMGDKAKKCVAAFLAWNEKYKPQFLSSEEMLVNHDLRFAGTRDLKCIINGETYTVDYKTSSTIQDKHKVQVAGYWACDKTDKAALLHLGNRTKQGYSFLEFDAPKYFEQFKHFNDTFEMMYPNAEPKIVEYPEFFTLNNL